MQIPIKYIDKNGNKAESSVLVRFSIVKNKFYDETAFPKGINPGNYALGKHAAKMEGISVVRARREIDFRRFDYYNVVNEPQHRWWGCEIIFTPELDEAFGVANNKQYVELKKVDVEDLDPDEVDICQFYLSRTYSDLIHDDRQINVFSKYKLEKHHIVPVGSVSKIGESTDILRKDKTNIVNSPLNYVFISDATNLEISNISLKEYEQDITASAKAALNIVNYPSVEKLNDKTTIKAWLKERYKILKGQIQNRVMNMLLS